MDGDQKKAQESGDLDTTPAVPNTQAAEASLKRPRDDEPGAAAETATKRKRGGPPPKVAPAKCLAVFGIGNKGAEHSNQRHNLGERVLLALARRRGITIDAGDSAPAGHALTVGERTCLLVLPQGHINESGPGLRAALEAASCQGATFLVVSDDCALPLGRLRMRRKGSCGGHNGLRSIGQEFGEDYHRLRIGIGGSASREHVIGDFTTEEEAVIAVAVERAAEGAEMWMTLGPEQLEAVMAKVNQLAFADAKAVGPAENPCGSIMPVGMEMH